MSEQSVTGIGPEWPWTTERDTEPGTEPPSPPQPFAAGPVLFARYAYPPNALGYCGQADPSALLGLTSAMTDLRSLGRMATGFEGAWPYLQLIASCNAIPDPLDPRVVEAYWTGNELLTRVHVNHLTSAICDRFEPRAGTRRDSLASAALAGMAQHSFHVFAVYPWLDLLRSGKTGPALSVLDRCRIRWGRLDAVDGDLVTVHTQRLTFDGSRLALGDGHLEQARRRMDGLALTDGLEPGAIVSLHWDWVCDRLTPDACDWLRYCTLRNLQAVNAFDPAPQQDHVAGCSPATR